MILLVPESISTFRAKQYCHIPSVTPCRKTSLISWTNSMIPNNCKKPNISACFELEADWHTGC